MLKKANRLKSRGDFKRTLAAKRVCANDCFVVYGLATRATVMQPSTEPKAPIEPRFGFIVSKKIHKRAVQRNKIRRRLRELVRTFVLTDKRPAALQFRTLVFIARSGSLTASYQDLRNRMDRCFHHSSPTSLKKH